MEFNLGNLELRDTATAYRNSDPDLEGFEIVDVKRGFTEIKPIFEAIAPFNAFICGGYVRYMVSNRHNPFPAGDVDIYSNDESVFKELQRVFRLGIKHVNDISVTYATPNSGPFQYCPTIQLIKPVTRGSIVSQGSMEDVLSNFDFSVVRCGLMTPDKAKVDKNFLSDETKGLLRLKNIHCPISSMFRVIKYSKKGYWMKPMESLKLFLDWDQRDEGYRQEIIDYLAKANEGEGLSQEEIDKLEALMRID